MADKMMRISGRGTDGTAKAIKTDNDGNIFVNPTKGQIFESGRIMQTVLPGQEIKILDVVGFLSIESLGMLFEGAGANAPNIGFRMRLKNKNLVTHKPLSPYYDEFWHSLYLMDIYGDPVWELLRYDSTAKRYTIALKEGRGPLLCPYGVELMVRNSDSKEMTVIAPYFYKVLEA